MELWAHHIAWQLAAVVGFVYAGALDAWPGRVALGLTALSWLLLLRGHREAQSAAAAVAAALDEGIGADSAATLSPAARPWLTPAFDWPTLALPFPVRHRDVVRTANVPFHGAGRDALRLDVFTRRDRPTGCPTFVYVHGGGWVIGHRQRQGLPLLLHLAARGWVCFSVDYRLSPAATFPDHLVDVKRALAWVREHAAEYGADPDFVVIGGNSAGGHLAALAALTPNDPAYQPGFEGADTSVAACVGFYGVYDFADRHGHWPHQGMRWLLERAVMKVPRSADAAAYERASPIARVHPEAPAFLVVHGDQDGLAPVAEARRFVAELRRVSRAPVAYAEIPGAQHAFDIFPSVRTGHVVEGVTRFLAHVFTRHRGG
jgi:acetyl esterase/lipase